MSGLGEYFTEPTTGLPNMSGLGEYFTEPVSGLGEYVETARTDAYQAQAGLGATVEAAYPSYNFSWTRERPARLARLAALSPLMGAIGDVQATAAAEKSGTVPMSENGKALAAGAGAVLAVALAGLALRGGLGYLVGKAVAPDAEREAKYAWWGVAAAIVGGTLGLGIEAAVALNARK